MNGVKELRESKGMSQSALARSLGVSQQLVNLWEKHGSSLREYRIEKFMAVFGRDDVEKFLLPYADEDTIRRISQYRTSGTDTEISQISKSPNKIREFREAKGLSQAKLAKMLGVSPQLVNYWENSDNPLKEHRVQKFIDVFGRDEIEKYIEKSINQIPINDRNFIVYESDNKIPVIPQSLWKLPEDLMEHSKTDAKFGRTDLIKQFPQHDMYIQVLSDSMKPNLMLGDMLAMSHRSKDAPVMNGRTYVVESRSHGVFVCNLYEKESDYQCRFNNESRYEPFNLSKDDVVNIFEVVGMYRLNV